jgi:hypothetical protein
MDPRLHELYQKYIQGNWGPILAGTFVGNPLTAAIPGAIGQYVNTPSDKSPTLQSIGVGGGAAAANALVRPIVKFLLNPLSKYVDPASTVFEWLTGMPLGLAQTYGAKKGRDLTTYLEDALKKQKNKKDNKINLDSFHKLNPEAKPKTAEQFKLAFVVSPGWTQAMNVGKAGLRSAAPGALVGGALGYLSAPEGHGMEGLGRGALTGGLLAGAGGATHHGLMTGAGDLSKAYQTNVGKPLQAAQVDRNKEMLKQRRQNVRAHTEAQAAAAAEAPAKAAQYYYAGNSDALNSFKIG